MKKKEKQQITTAQAPNRLKEDKEAKRTPQKNINPTITPERQAQRGAESMSQWLAFPPDEP